MEIALSAVRPDESVDDGRLLEKVSRMVSPERLFRMLLLIRSWSPMLSVDDSLEMLLVERADLVEKMKKITTAAGEIERLAAETRDPY